MKKLISLLLVCTMVLSLGVVVFAEGEEPEYQTEVTYSGKYSGGGGTGGTEEYTLEVPETIEAGGDAKAVKLTGHWPANRQVVVDAEDTVTLSYSGSSETVNVNFAGITKVGSNVSELEVTENISVDEPNNAYFGDWKGVFSYTAKIENVA